MMKDNWKHHNNFDNDDCGCDYDEKYNEFDDEEIEDSIKERKMLSNLDSDILKYFNEAYSSKSKLFTKKKKEKIIYKVGDSVKVGNKIGTILYGPYEKNNKQYYEVETAEGIVTVEEKNIKN